MIKAFLITAWVFLSSNIISQTLTKVKVGIDESRNGVLEAYEFIPRYDGQIGLTLFTNGSYLYQVSSTLYNSFSKGKWVKIGRKLILTSEIDSTNVPIRIKYLTESDSINGKLKTLFSIPVNTKGEPMSESTIHINNDSTYCFPFFDTCMNSYSTIDSIRVDFGSGFTSQWVHVKHTNAKQILITANIDFLVESFLVFKKRSYKINDSQLILVEE